MNSGQEMPEDHPPKQQQLTESKFSLTKITSKAKSWKLPEELADFLQERCNTHMTKKELDEFMSTATPSNLKEATKLDPFIKTLLEKKGLNKTVSMDDEQQKIHEKLSKVWDLYRLPGGLYRRL